MDPSQTESSPSATPGRRYFRGVLAAFALIIALVMYPKTGDPTGDIKYLFLAWTALVLGVWWVTAIWWFGLPARRPALFLELMICFLFFLGLATAFSPYHGASLIETSRFLFLFVLYLIAAQAFRTPQQVRFLMQFLVGAAALAAVYAFCQRTGLDPFPWADKGSDVYTNLPATFGNPNFAAHVLVLAIIMAIYLGFTSERRRDDAGQDQAPRAGSGGRGWWFVLLALAAHLIATHQRAGLVALAVAAILVLIGMALSRLHRPVLATVLTLFFTALVSAAAAAGAMAFLYWRSGSPFPVDLSLLLRYQAYISSTHMVLAKPFLGFGPGVYAIVNPEYWTAFEQQWYAQELRMNAHVHNDLLELAVDGGLPLAGIYLALLVTGICHGLGMAFNGTERKRRLLGYTFAAACCAFLVDGLFGFNLRVPVSASYLFLLLGAMDGLATPTPAAAPAKVSPPALLWRTAFILVLVFATVLESRGYAAKYALRQGMVEALAGNFGAAEAFMAKGSKLAPWNARVARQRGKAAMNAGKYEAASEHFDASLDCNPYSIETRVSIAQSSILEAQAKMQEGPRAQREVTAALDRADSELDRVLELCPELPQAHEVYGKSVSMRAVSANPTAAPALWDEAERHLAQAIHFGARNPGELWLLIAQIRIERNMMPQAEEAFVRAVQYDPSQADAWNAFVSYAHEQRRYRRIRGTLYNLLARMEEEKAASGLIAATYLRLAEVLESSGVSGDAVDEAYRGAALHAPERNEIWARFGRYAIENDRMTVLRTAIAEACAQLRAEDKKPPVHVDAINALFRDGVPVLLKASKALAALVRAHMPGAPLSAAQEYGWAAQLLLDAAEKSGAEAPCEVHLNLGIVCAATDNLILADSAFSHADACLGDTLRPYLAINWADTLERLGRTGDALNKLTAAKDSFPENLDLQWELAKLHTRSGKIAEARAVYDAILAQPGLDPEGERQLRQERDALQAAPSSGQR